jgi:hypothetical protein
MNEYRVLDRQSDNFYHRYEVQMRTRFCGIWGWWVHLTGFHNQEDAIAHLQTIEDMYSVGKPVELYRTRTK